MSKRKIKAETLRKKGLSPYLAEKIGKGKLKSRSRKRRK